MSGTRGAQVRRIMAAQAGVIALSQIRAAGYSDGWARTQVARGVFRRIGPKMYVDAALGMSRRAELFGASLATDGVVDGLSAAQLHGLIATAPARVTVTVPQRCWTKVPYADVQRRDMPHGFRTTIHGIPVLTREHTVLDCLPLPGGLEALDTALARRLVTLPRLQRLHEENPSRKGGIAAGTALRDARLGTRSALERLSQPLLKQVGFPEFVRQYRIAGYLVDVAFVTERIAIEFDGFAFHSSRRDHANDLRRQNAIMNAGWRVLRFTYDDVTTRCDYVVSAIAAALTARAS